MLDISGNMKQAKQEYKVSKVGTSIPYPPKSYSKNEIKNNCKVKK